MVNSAGFASWVRTYDKSRVSQDSVPEGNWRAAFMNFLVVSSHLPRSIHSAEISLGRRPDLLLRDLREMEMPRFKLPLRMPAYSWLTLNRSLWMMGLKGRCESFRDAKRRASRASEELQRLAQAHGRVVVFGHSMMNTYIAEGLLAMGWQGSAQPTPYWGVMHLTKS